MVYILDVCCYDIIWLIVWSNSLLSTPSVLILTNFYKGNGIIISSLKKSPYSDSFDTNVFVMFDILP
jgi:hypothetical protein